MKEPTEIVPSEEIEVYGDALPVVASGDVDIQIATAKRYPRSIDLFLTNSKSLIAEDERVADDCMYAKPQGGKKIIGASIRLAEIAASNYGNLVIGSQEVAIEHNRVIVQGVCWDLEKNVRISKQVSRSIVGNNGRYPQHMIVTTAMAAQSIALRNAIFSIIPKTYINSLLRFAREIVLGDEDTMVKKRTKMFEFLKENEISQQQVFDLLGVHGIKDITGDKYIELRGYLNAVSQGDMTIQELFSPKEEKKKPPTGAGSKRTIRKDKTPANDDELKPTSPETTPEPEITEATQKIATDWIKKIEGCKTIEDTQQVYKEFCKKDEDVVGEALAKTVTNALVRKRSEIDQNAMNL